MGPGDVLIMVKHACISLQCSVLQLYVPSYLHVLGLMLCVIATYSVLVVCVLSHNTNCLCSPHNAMHSPSILLVTVTPLDAYDSLQYN